MTRQVDDGYPPRMVPSVVVLTYNSGSSLSRCLEALAPQVEQLGGELFVVDNGSSDATREVARAAGFEALANPGNVGFAAGCNAAARHGSGEVLVFVNPDAVLDPGALAAIVDAAARPAVGPVGGRAHGADGTYDARSVHGPPTMGGALAFAVAFDKLVRNSRFDRSAGPSKLPATGPPCSVPAVSGAFIAVPRELWDRLGGFDERYFLYGEDIDLSVRSTALGWQPTFAPEAGYHHVGGTSSPDGTARDVWLYRGKVELYRRHLGPIAARIAVVALQVGVFVRGVPATLPLDARFRQATRWWRLFGRRRVWRTGFRDHVPGQVVA